jgi:hypothetical protein
MSTVRNACPTVAVTAVSEVRFGRARLRLTSGIPAHAHVARETAPPGFNAVRAESEFSKNLPLHRR